MRYGGTGPAGPASVRPWLRTALLLVVCAVAASGCPGEPADELKGVACPLQGVCASGTVRARWSEREQRFLCSYELPPEAPWEPDGEVSCDGLDNDCDGSVDEGLEGLAPPAEQQQGVCAGRRKVCGGSEGWLEPGTELLEGFEPREMACDGLDNDCDGATDEDLPVPPTAMGLGVCRQQPPTCEGLMGWQAPDPRGIAGYEPSERSCDDLDNDCDGVVDEIDATLEELCGAELLCCPTAGVCGAEAGPWAACAGGALRCLYPQLNGFEVVEARCDGLDNDCDGLTDEMLLVAEQACAAHGICCHREGVCGLAELAEGHCPAGAWRCRYESDDRYEPGAELSCDGLDNDCDGLTDEQLEPPEGLCPEQGCAGAGALCLGVLGWRCAVAAAPRCGLAGVCAGAEQTAAVCTADGWHCVGAPPDLYEPGAEQSCDGLDNDCDGETDEGLCGLCGPWPPGALECAADEGRLSCGPDGFSPAPEQPDPCEEGQTCLGPGRCDAFVELLLQPGRGVEPGAVPALGARAATEAEVAGEERVLVAVAARPDGEPAASIYLAELGPDGALLEAAWLGTHASRPGLTVSPASSPAAPCALLTFLEQQAEGPALRARWVGSGCGQDAELLTVRAASATLPEGAVAAVDEQGRALVVWLDATPPGQRALHVVALLPGEPPRRLHPDGLLRDLRWGERSLSWIGRPGVTALPSGGFFVTAVALDMEEHVGAVVGLGLDPTGGLLPGWDSARILSEVTPARLDAACAALLSSPGGAAGVGGQAASAAWSQWHIALAYRRRAAHDPEAGTWVLRRLEPSLGPDAPGLVPVDGELPLVSEAHDAPARLQLLPLPGGRLLTAMATPRGVALQDHSRWLRPTAAPHPEVELADGEPGWAAAALSGERIVWAQLDGDGGLLVRQRELDCPAGRDFCDPGGERRRCDPLGRGATGVRGCAAEQRCAGVAAECVPVAPSLKPRPPTATLAPALPAVTADSAGNVVVAAAHLTEGARVDQLASWSPSGINGLIQVPLHFLINDTEPLLPAWRASLDLFEDGRLAVAYDNAPLFPNKHCVGVFTLNDGEALAVGTQRCFDADSGGFPDLEPLPSGGFVVASHGPSSTVTLRGWNRDGGVSWEAPSSATGRLPTLASLPSGGVGLVTYHARSLTLHVFRPTAAPESPPQPTSEAGLELPLVTALDARAAVAATEDGRLAVAARGWVAERDNMALLPFALQPEPAPLAEPQPLETQAWTVLEHPTLVALQGADVAALWIATEPRPEQPGRWHLRLRRAALQQPGPWQEPRSLVSGDAELHQVRATRLPSGALLVVWLQGAGAAVEVMSLVVDVGAE